MKLSEACALAEECGLQTIKEAILNVEIHSPSLFAYDDIEYELQELYLDSSKVSLDSSVSMFC